MSARGSFIFAGGGTGGHLFPALAIAERLDEIAAGSTRCHFVCSTRSLDREILEGERAGFTPIKALPLSVRPPALARFVRAWGPAVEQGRLAIRAAREHADRVGVVAMGGYVSAPVVRAAQTERASIILVNLDASPGRANRWIARHADRVLSAAGPTRDGWERVGPIVRSMALARGPRQHARLRLGLDPDRPTLLVTGASQGARTINELVTGMLDTDRSIFHGWQVIHQTGREMERAVGEAYERAGVPALVRAFFRDMGELWGSADLAVSRGGAGSVAEAWANRVPALFMPYPHHRDQHQRLNAVPLTEAGGALVARDHAETGANRREAGMRLTELMADSERRSAMRAALAQLGPTDGAQRVATILLESIG